MSIFWIECQVSYYRQYRRIWRTNDEDIRRSAFQIANWFAWMIFHSSVIQHISTVSNAQIIKQNCKCFTSFNYQQFVDILTHRLRVCSFVPFFFSRALYSTISAIPDAAIVFSFFPWLPFLRLLNIFEAILGCCWRSNSSPDRMPGMSIFYYGLLPFFFPVVFPLRIDPSNASILKLTFVAAFLF